MTEALQKFEARIELLEQWLIDLAFRCWESCGTDFAKELAEEIKMIKANQEKTDR